MTALGAIYDDTSYYQPPLDLTYPRGIACFRGFDGTWPDPLFRTNLKAAAALVKANRVSCVVVYLVYRPGTARAQAAAFRAAVTAVLGKVPRWLCAEIDAESWGGKIQGNRSGELNQLYALLCQFLHADARRTGGYANRGDFAALWPTRPPRMRTRLARYGRLDSTFPGQIAQQYTDGQPKFAIPGLPSSTPPHGRCDHNIAHGLTPATFAVAMGAILSATTPQEVDAVANQIQLSSAQVEAIGQAEATWHFRRELGGVGYDGSYAKYLMDARSTQLQMLAAAEKALAEEEKQTRLLQQLVDAAKALMAQPAAAAADTAPAHARPS